MSVVVMDRSDGEGMLVVSTPLHGFVMCAGTAAAKDEWVAALQGAVRKLFAGTFLPSFLPSSLPLHP